MIITVAGGCLSFLFLWFLIGAILAVLAKLIFPRGWMTHPKDMGDATVMWCLGPLTLIPISFELVGRSIKGIVMWVVNRPCFGKAVWIITDFFER